MNLIKILSSKKFERLDQFEKNKLLNKYILQDKDCKIGLKVLCFQKEVLMDEKNKWMYKKYGKQKVVTTISVGTQYTVIDYKEGKIKIINNEGKNMWYTIDRFLYSLKLERKEKLKKINLCQTE
jgi:hypothetical protein